MNHEVQDGLITDSGIVKKEYHVGSKIVGVLCGIVSLALIALGILSYLYEGGVIQ